MDRLRAAWEWFASIFEETPLAPPESTCAGCGHAESLHRPECREVTAVGTRTADWYCRCRAFVPRP